MNDRELLQQALDTLKTDKDHASYESGVLSLCAAIEYRLKQPDPVLFTEFKSDNYGWWRDDDGKLKLGTIPKLEPEETVDGWPLYSGIPKPKKEWVGLTMEERDEINNKVYGWVPHHVVFHHAIEQALKEKNGH